MKKLLPLIAYSFLALFFLLAPKARAAITIDASSSVKVSDQSWGTAATSFITTPAFNTSNANDLIVAIVSVGINGTAGGTFTATSSAPSLTFTSAIKKSVQGGMVQIFWAYATSSVSGMKVTAKCTANCGVSAGGSMAVYAFSGVDTTSGNGSSAIGATASSSNASGSSKAPSSTLTTTRAGSWVVAGVDDFDSNRAFTAGSNQTILSQEGSATNDTEFDLRQNATTANSGTAVVMNATPASTDAYNMADLEILAPAVASGASAALPRAMSTVLGILQVKNATFQVANSTLKIL